MPKLQQMPPEYLTTLGCRTLRKEQEVFERSMDQVLMHGNQREVSKMKFNLNKAMIQWNDAQKDKEAIKKILKKVADNFEPTEDEVNNIETEINRERKFNTVSKLKHSLDSAQQANARKFKARYKQTNKTFLKEVEMIVHLANLEMEE